VALTNSGRQAAKADRIASAPCNGLIAGFRPEEVETMHRVLQGLGTALETAHATINPAIPSG